MKPSGFGVVLVCACLAGCGEELDPLHYPARTVTGTVRFRGKPLSAGWIEFAPIDGTVGAVATARLTDGGRYTARHVAVGRHRVKIVRTVPPLPPEFSTDDSTLTVTVSGAGEGEATLDLALP